MSFEHIAALAEVGRFTLPAELLAAEAERARLVKATSELRRTLPEYDGSTQANLNADAIRAADNAADRADDRVRNFMRGNGNDTRIVTESLRPAFEAVLKEVRELPKDTPTTADDAVTATQKARDAYIKLAALVPVYGAIIEAAEILYGAGRDNWRLFADTQAAPTSRPGQLRNFTKPGGPEGRAARLLWLADDSNSWLPTARERDARYLEWTTMPIVDRQHSAAVNNI
jgi:hypothetical protein